MRVMRGLRGSLLELMGEVRVRALCLGNGWCVGFLVMAVFGSGCVGVIPLCLERCCDGIDRV